MKPLFSLLVIAGLLSSCGSSTSSNTSNDTLAVDTSTTIDTGAITETKNEPAKAESKWQYQEKADKMSAGKKYYASIDSDNSIDFEFPYDGGSTRSINRNF